MPEAKLFAGNITTIPVQSIEEMTVHSYNTENNRIWVSPRDGRPVEAIPISATPTSDQGAGFFVDPKPGTECVVLRQGERRGDSVIWHQHYLLGYHAILNDLGTRGGVMANEPSKSGDVTWHGTGQTQIKQTKFGTIGILANLWNRIEMSQVTQTLVGFFRNLKIRMRGGKIEWYTSTDKISKFHAEIHDKYEPDAQNDINAGTSLNYANKVVVDAGTLNAGNIIDIQTRQDTDGDNVADEITKIRIGRPDGGALQHITLETNTGQQTIDEQILVNSEIAHRRIYTHGGNVASRSIIIDTKAGQEDIVLFEDETVTESTGRGLDNKPLIKSQAVDVNSNTVLQEVLIDSSTMYKIDINNGKAQLHIDADGNVKVLSANETIYLGGTGKEQQLTTKSFLQMHYPFHTHICASPGAPTSPVMQPLVFLPVDSPTNIVTVTTKAE